MATYTINVINNGQPVYPNALIFYLFCEVPEVSSAAGSANPYSNTLAQTLPLQGDGSQGSFVVTNDAWALCGSQVIEPNAVVTSFDKRSMSLGGGTDVDVAQMIVVNGGPGFKATTTGASPGSFNIVVPSYDAVEYPDIWCGYGKAPHGATTPTAAACWQAKPGLTYEIQPVVTFYVAMGTYTPGEVVNLTALSDKVEIDFTKQGKKTVATTTWSNEGQFSPPAFTYPPTDKE